MDSATISALAALGGATVGGVTSFATTWLSQQRQAKIQQLTHNLNRREELHKAFITEASKLYADALVNEMSDASKLVGLYALISEMRVISSRQTVEGLEQMVNAGKIDVLQSFSEAARQEFHKLGV